MSPLYPLSPVRRRQVSTVTIVRMEESLCGCSSLLSVLRCYVGKFCSNLLQAIIDHWNPRQTKLLEQRTLWYGPSLQGSSHHLLALQMCVDMISMISTYLHNLARPRDLYCGLNISCAAAGHIKVRLGTAACSMQLAAHCRLQHHCCHLPAFYWTLITLLPLCVLSTSQVGHLHFNTCLPGQAHWLYNHQLRI